MRSSLRVARFRRVSAVLLLPAVLLLVASCMTTADVVTDRIWTLVSIDGQRPVAAAGLRLGSDGQMTVEPGCNHGGGSFSIKGNRIVNDGPIALTAMSCLDDKVGLQEAAFMVVVNADPVFALDTGTGQLRLEAHGVTLLFSSP